MSEQNNASRNVIVAGLWKTRNGHYNTAPIDAKAYDTLQKCFEQGGKFLIRNRTPESIANAKNPETTPTAYLEFVPAEAVIEFNAAKANRQSGL